MDNTMFFFLGREEDDPLPRRQDREHQGREVHPGLQGRIRGDEEVDRKYPDFALTITFPRHFAASGRGVMTLATPSPPRAT